MAQSSDCVGLLLVSIYLVEMSGSTTYTPGQRMDHEHKVDAWGELVVLFRLRHVEVTRS